MLAYICELWAKSVVKTYNTNKFSEPEFIRQLQESVFRGATMYVGKFFVDGEKIIHYNKDDFRTS